MTIDWDVAPHKVSNESLGEIVDGSVYVNNLDDSLSNLTDAFKNKFEILGEQIYGLHKSVASGFDTLWLTLLFVIAFLIFDYFF